MVVCGANKKLYSFFNKKIKQYQKKIMPFGFIGNINELMSISDLIISKPGGVTTAEVLSKRLPMVIVKPIPGQEESNSDYLTQKAAALRIDRPDEIGGLVDYLFSQPQKLQQMSEAASVISRPSASLDIAKLVLSL
jgi:processive 1,2-diacylglycerol beta-glucosyltransferase